MTASRRRLSATVAVIAAVFLVCYGQAPLYSANQNTYFLHGLANAGVGTLDHDWLTGTDDPFPVFSALVEATSRTAGGSWFYAEHALLVLLYAVALLLVVVVGRPTTLGQLIVPGVGMIAIHSLLLADLSDRVLGRDLSSILTWGVADQYVLGTVLQPSAFGVFLIASLAAFLRHRLLIAAALAIIAPTFHATYLWAAGVLILSYALAELNEGGRGRARAIAKMFALSALGVAPTVGYAADRFYSTGASDVERRQAAFILAHERIPHHALPGTWFGSAAAVQLLIVAGAIATTGERRLRIPLATLAAAGAVLTAVQLVSGSDSLALLFPWRVSVVLVPVSSALLLGRLGALVWSTGASRLPTGARWAMGAVAAMLVLVATGYGAFELADRPSRAGQEGAEGAIAYLRTSGDGGTVLVPPGLEGFRIAAEVPIVVDGKSHPYRDVDVLAWNERLGDVETAYDDVTSCDDVEATMRRYGATWVVSPSDHVAPGCASLVLAYADEAFLLYRLTTDPS